VLEAQWASLRLEIPEERLGETVIVVAGHEDHFAALQGFGETLKERAPSSDDIASMSLEQLEGIAEQDNSVSAGDTPDQSVEDHGVADQVTARRATKVQIGNDRGFHSEP
jgi:hypothetical protein